MIYMVTTGGDCPLYRSAADDEDYHYVDPTSDESILSSITPSLVQIKEMVVSQANVKQHDNEVHPARQSFVSRKQHSQLLAESLSEKWYIGPKRAKATLLATTQNGVRSAILPLSRRYRADRMFSIKQLDGKFATDTFFSKVKSIHMNTCCQVFSHKVGFQACYPKTSTTGDNLGEALDDFVHDFCTPMHLTFDGHQSQAG